MDVELRCPQCRRFLASTQDFARVLCRDCDIEISYKSKEQRRRERLSNNNVPVTVDST